MYGSGTLCTSVTVPCLVAIVFNMVAVVIVEIGRGGEEMEVEMVR